MINFKSSTKYTRTAIIGLYLIDKLQRVCIEKLVELFK